MSTLKKYPCWTKKLARAINNVTVQNKDEVFLWKAVIIFILTLLALSVFYFVRLSYQKTNALLDETSDTVINKSGFSIENINMAAFEKAVILIDYKKNPLTLPPKIRNVFFYEQTENINYVPPVTKIPTTTSFLNISTTTIE